MMAERRMAKESQHLSQPMTMENCMSCFCVDISAKHLYSTVASRPTPPVVTKTRGVKTPRCDDGSGMVGRVQHPFPTSDLGREGLVSYDCWYMCGAEGWNTVHSARHRYADSSRGYSSKLLLCGNI